MTDRILVSLANGRWLALSREQFDAALMAGAEFDAQSAPSSAPVEPLLDAEHAGALLSVTPRWLEDCARAGIIPHHKLGRFLRFRVSEVADHCRVHGAPIPGTALATDSESVAPFRRQARQ